jgi:subtilisin family serine protease
MDHLQLVKLAPLMSRTSGSPEIKIGLIDGPVLTEHPNLSREHLIEIPGKHGISCARADSSACLHGTFIAGVLSANRGSPAPAICPKCTLLIRPIFGEGTLGGEQMPSAAPEELAAAIIECTNSGAKVISLSLAVAEHYARGEQSLEEALNQAVRRSVIVVAAAGNQGTLGSSAITRHSGVIPVVACDLRGKPLNESNLGSSIGRRGLTAPGDAVTSLGAGGQSLSLSGTSVAVPFVTGTIALLWSEFPGATATQIRLAVSQTSAVRRVSVVPPLMDSEAAYQSLLSADARS